MIVQCEGCKTKYRINEAIIGNKIRQFKCRKCQAAVVISPPKAQTTEGVKAVTSDSGKKKRVVVADDTAFFRVMLSDLLKNGGYEVIEAKDGEEAINKVMRELPDLDLLLLDMLMPKADGFTVIQEIKRTDEGRDLPILAVSGVFKSEEDRKLMKELGIVGYVDKNTPPGEILNRVNLILNPDAVS